jgi:hypothetical protein
MTDSERACLIQAQYLEYQSFCTGTDQNIDSFGILDASSFRLPTTTTLLELPPMRKPLVCRQATVEPLLAVAASIVELAVIQSDNVLGGCIRSDWRGDKERRTGFEPTMYGHPYVSIGMHCHVLMWLQGRSYL